LNSSVGISPFDKVVIMRSNPKFWRLSKIDAEYVLDSIEPFADIFSERGIVPEEDFYQILSGAPDEDVDNCAPKTGGMSLNEMSISRQRAADMTNPALQAAETKKASDKVDKAAATAARKQEAERKRSTKAAEKEAAAALKESEKAAKQVAKENADKVKAEKKHAAKAKPAPKAKPRKAASKAKPAKQAVALSVPACLLPQAESTQPKLKCYGGKRKSPPPTGKNDSDAEHSLNAAAAPATSSTEAGAKKAKR
jgi:flagellar biosynthesis GTPase FlhF